MLQLLHRYVIPAALAVLPRRMTSPEAVAMLLAIALQESGAISRRQRLGGPARGFWQFEAGGGVLGVQRHPRTASPLEGALVALCYPAQLETDNLHKIIEHNDIAACVLARLLLYSLPERLPGPVAVDEAWRQYIAAWQPGRPHPDTWAGYYAVAWDLAASEIDE